MSIYQKVNQTKIVKTLFCIHFPEGCLSLTQYSIIKKCHLRKNGTVIVIVIEMNMV